MDADIISKSILNEIEDVVYIADPVTHDLYYMNAMCLKTLGNPPEEQWRRKKCYKVLQGLDAPCPFCTNEKLTRESFYNWEHHNTLLERYFDIQDKLVEFEGVLARLEIAKDVTGRKMMEQDLKRRLKEQQVLNNCVALLHTADAPDISINKLLAQLAEFHDAERAYIFAISADGLEIDNTYEWCVEGIEPQIEMLQHVPKEVVAHWFEKYEEQGEFYIDSLTDELDPDSDEFQILDVQGITSLVTAPLRNVRGVATGFIGVDNPKKDVKNTFIIRTVSNFIADFIDKNEKIRILNKISYYDNLTDLKNRHSYSNTIAEMEINPPSTLGVIYVDINGLKAINDKHGHKEGDVYIKNISDFLKDLYDDCAYRIGGDEFVMLCAEKEESCFYNKLGLLTRHIEKDAFPVAAIGYVWRMGNCNVIEQIELADAQMYKNKEAQYAMYSGKHEIFRRKYLADAAHHDSEGAYKD